MLNIRRGFQKEGAIKPFITVTFWHSPDAERPLRSELGNSKLGAHWPAGGRGPWCQVVAAVSLPNTAGS